VTPKLRRAVASGYTVGIRGDRTKAGDESEVTRGTYFAPAKQTRCNSGGPLNKLDAIVRCRCSDAIPNLQQP